VLRHFAPEDPILAKHYPEICTCDPVISVQPAVSVPPLELPDIRNHQNQEQLHEYCIGISEWLALKSINSPRIASTDSVDPYISRYEVPDRDLANKVSVVSLKWHGFLTSIWILQLFIALL
jgi:ribonuclease P/MRP protein subunit RPP40